MEEEILMSNDWQKYKPRYIIVEQKNITIEELMNSNIYHFLARGGYSCEWKNIRSVIYKLNE
jgi:hypothetical protein